MYVYVELEDTHDALNDGFKLRLLRRREVLEWIPTGKTRLEFSPLFFGTCYQLTLVVTTPRFYGTYRYRKSGAW